MFDLELNIRSWNNYVRAHGHLKDADILELENHLRDEIEDLTKAGLTQDESFLIGVKRLGNVSAISEEYAKVNTENLWKQLLSDPENAIAAGRNWKEIGWVILFSLIAGTLMKVPELFGFKLFNDADILFYFKNLGLFILPFVAAFFLIKHQSGWKRASIILGIFCLSAVVINIYPSHSPHDTEMLTGIHLPIFLWLATGAAYLGTEWKESRRRMDFIRFTGEVFIYGVLIFCGIIVLSLFTLAIFNAIHVDLSSFIEQYLVVYGGCATVMIAVYLAEAKKSIVENFAPVLAKIFIPLFLLTMVAFLAVMIVSGKSPFIDREFLIGFDLMLVLVLGLVLYSISARDPRGRNKLFDFMNLALILASLAIDGIALFAILVRLTSFGVTPNKVAALGENLILLVNLGGLAWLYICHLFRKTDFEKLEKWQTSYLYVYAVWMGVVAFLFPIIFHFS